MKTTIKCTAKSGVFFLFMSALFALQPFVFADGNIDPTNKYAWAENEGWLNFNPTNYDGATVFCKGGEQIFR